MIESARAYLPSVRVQREHGDSCESTEGSGASFKAVADDAGQGWNILGVIGPRKGSQLSTRCKFLSRALAVYCLAQLPESKRSSDDSAQPQTVRFTPHAPGVAPPLEQQQQSTTVNEVRPSAEAVRAMQSLEALLLNKQYAELKGDIELSIKMIRDSSSLYGHLFTISGLCGYYSHEYSDM